jgi:hypothetical protein
MYFIRQNVSFNSPVSPTLLLADFAVRIARELWWTNQEFCLSISFHCGSPCSYITWGMNSRPVGGRSSETWSRRIDMIFMIQLSVKLDTLIRKPSRTTSVEN